MTSLKRSQTNEISLLSEQDTIQFAQLLAKACEAESAVDKGLVVYLQGDLGAGKSFFSRAFIQYYLPGQKVKSPTYTIVESYKSSKVSIHHFDLYRLCDPEELEYLAIRDLLVDNYVALVEWPQKGAPIFPQADIVIRLQHPSGDQADCRTATVEAISTAAQVIVEQLLAQIEIV